MSVFTIPEIVDIGIEKEKKRRDFYAQVAERFADKDIKELFTKLKNWEEMHIKRFSEIRDNMKESGGTDSYPGELRAYADALLDDTLYKAVTPHAFSRTITTPLSAVQHGIGFEKDAILFFSEFQPYLLDHDREIVQQLINEEKQHIVYLADLKKKMEHT